MCFFHGFILTTLQIPRNDGFPPWFLGLVRTDFVPSLGPAGRGTDPGAPGSRGSCDCLDAGLAERLSRRLATGKGPRLGASCLGVDEKVLVG